jgi:hypothetical protein
MITVYQIHLSDSEIRVANSQGFEAVPKVLAKTRMMLGAGKWNHTDYPKYYEATYEIDTNDLDEAYEMTNLWESDWMVTRLRRGSSSSVGDIFVKDGDCYIVDNFGFVAIGRYPELTSR